tara:strand:- start:681 stop:863 length:183 start_codon:yes stop_codon:yes gene_type:complete
MSNDLNEALDNATLAGLFGVSIGRELDKMKEYADTHPEDPAYDSLRKLKRSTNEPKGDYQ